MKKDTTLLMKWVVFTLIFIWIPVSSAGVLSVPAAALLPRDNNVAYDTNGVRMAVPDIGDHVF